MNTTPTEQLSVTHVQTKANVYFGGKCVSHSLTLADGSKKSVGVMLAGELSFTTGVAEIMECVAGACEFKIGDSQNWQSCKAAERFSVPANTAFAVRVASEYHYICHFA